MMKIRERRSILGSALRLPGRGLAILAVACAAQSANAAITWNFDYTMAPHFMQEAKDSLASAALVTSGFFNHTATIEMKVTSLSDAMSSTLASAGSNPAVGITPVSGFNNLGTVMGKIQSGGAIDGNGATADGNVEVNFGYSVIPEPSTLCLLFIGSISLFAAARRRHAS